MKQSLYQCHVDKWRKGCGADICKRATRVVFARGFIPCDVCFVGEAPGDSEDSLGLPFVGPAGQLLDKMIEQAIPLVTEIGDDGWTEHHRSPYLIAFYNLLGCIPYDVNYEKMKEPPDTAIVRCKPRLEEFLAIAQPKLIVAVGKHADVWLEQGYKHSVKLPDRDTPIVKILHPAFILRQIIAQQSMLRKKTVITLAEAVQKHLSK